MIGGRFVTALVGLVFGLALSVAAWYYFDTLAVFLFLPFVPIFFRSPRGPSASATIARRDCPACDFSSRDPKVAYCPRDGHRLVER
ncbi:hypothetical protein ACNS7O_08950 [Haloferacaceae archaeon DSL9]